MSATRTMKRRKKKKRLSRSRIFPVNVTCECGFFYQDHFVDGTCPGAVRKFSAAQEQLIMPATHDRRSMHKIVSRLPPLVACEDDE